jgi:riboflavin biosynthesis pyrimidine reductase
MTLTVPGEPRQPLRCIVSRRGELDASHPVFHKAGGQIHLLVTENTDCIAPPGAWVHHGMLEDFLTELAAEHGVRRLHCEGGGEMIRALAELDVIDEFHLTLAGHTLFGGLEAPSATGVAGAFLPRSLEFQMTYWDPRPDAGECFLSYRRLRGRNAGQ